MQALVRWEPVGFLLAEAERRLQAGFPAGHLVFRVAGADGLSEQMAKAGAHTVLATTAEHGTVCLVAVAPERFAAFRDEVVGLAAAGAVTRVEAEPQI